MALHVCHDLPCFLRDGDARLAELRERYGDDAEVELVEVSCLGRCDIAPAVAVNERPAPVEDADALVAGARGRARSAAAPANERAEPWPNDPYPAGSGVAERYATLRALLAGELDPDTIVHDAEGLRVARDGRRRVPDRAEVGAGPRHRSPATSSTPSATPTSPSRARSRTGRSWPPSRTWCWRGCCWAWRSWAPSRAGCSSATSTAPRSTSLRAELDALRAAGVIGPDACGSGRRLDVEVFVSPGGYILGEETALLECMEGHRGEPRNKPPFPGNYGLHGRPTLINSVETFADVPVIVQRGAQWWADQGAGDSVGWKFFAVSGHVERPDVYCVPMGTTVRELIELAGGVSGGREVGAVQPGGASSNFIGPDKLDMPLDFGAAAENGTMLGSGAMVVLAEGTDLLAASTNVLRFFRNESCGKCVPCRRGLDQGARDPARRRRVRLGTGRRPAGAHRAAGGGHAQDLHLRAGPGRAGARA